jgi:hypothetical protein
MTEQITDAEQFGIQLSMEQAFFAAMVQSVMDGKGGVFKAMIKETHHRRFSNKAEWPFVCKCLGLAGHVARAAGLNSSYERLVSDRIRLFDGNPEQFGFDCEA